jgi:hypothetical protein
MLSTKQRWGFGGLLKKKGLITPNDNSRNR